MSEDGLHDPGPQILLVVLRGPKIRPACVWGRAGSLTKQAGGQGRKTDRGKGIQPFPSQYYLLRIASRRRSAASSSFFSSSATLRILSTSRLIFEPDESIFENTSISPRMMPTSR
jgi:hypothetical protein